MITQTRLQNTYRYIPSGYLQNRKTGKTVWGTISKNGYTRISFRFGYTLKQFQYHRMIWLWHYGFLPKEIDHKDRNKSNNRIENLSPSTRRKNMLNVNRRENVGVYKRGNRFYAMLTVNNKNKYLGSFISEIKARRAISLHRLD